MNREKQLQKLLDEINRLADEPITNRGRLGAICFYVDQFLKLISEDIDDALS